MWLEPRIGAVLVAVAVVLISMMIEGSSVAVWQWLVLPALPLRAILLVVAATGAVVGAVHGVALVWLLRRSRSAQQRSAGQVV